MPLIPKKSLGQNFLTSEAAVYKIVKAAEIKSAENGNDDDKRANAEIEGIETGLKNGRETGLKTILETVLEIGPGKGVLTKALLEAGARVIAIEKDHRLIEDLSAKFAEHITRGQLSIIEGDALEIEPSEIGLESGKYKIVANLPYYITGQFLRKFLSGNNQPSRMVLLLQKEVVDRIIARDGKESLLSISIKVYGQPKKITVVDRGSFSPAPNVDSAVISIENISKDFFAAHLDKKQDIGQADKKFLDEDRFFEIVRAGFAHKRKMLVPNLVAGLDNAEPGNKLDKLPTSREKILAALTTEHISEKVRAEDLTVEQWKKIAENIVRQ